MLDTRLTGGIDSLTKEKRQVLGIYFPDELDGLQSERDNLRDTVQSKDELIAQKDEAIRKLQNQLNEEKKKKAKNGSTRIMSNRSKKRKK